MKLCIIILNYFGSGDTIACVQALLAQPADRICIIENSADRAELDALTGAFEGQPKIEIISSGRNLGFAGGVNRGLQRMLPLGFDAFILLNNDTVLPPDLIGRLLTGAEQSCLDIASPVIYCYPDRDALWSRGNHYNIWTGVLSTQAKRAVPGDVFYLPGCCLLVRRRVFEIAGLLDAEFFMYGEDVEFCHRAAQKGFRIGIVSDARIYHKTGASAVHNSRFYEDHINRGHLLLACKLSGSAGAQALSLCIKTVTLLARGLVRTVRFKNFNALCGYGRALAGLFAR